NSAVPSALLPVPVRSAVESTASRVPSALIAGASDQIDVGSAPVVLVTWVIVPVAVLYRNTSWLPSAFAPVRSAVEERAIRVPSAEMEDATDVVLAVLVTGVSPVALS